MSIAKKSQYIDIKIDKLTNSLENLITGDNFPTDIVITDMNYFKSITKKEGWLFDWKSEFKMPEAFLHLEAAKKAVADQKKN